MSEDKSLCSLFLRKAVSFFALFFSELFLWLQVLDILIVRYNKSSNCTNTSLPHFKKDNIQKRLFWKSCVWLWSRELHSVNVLPAEENQRVPSWTTRDDGSQYSPTQLWELYHSASTSALIAADIAPRLTSLKNGCYYLLDSVRNPRE